MTRLSRHRPSLLLGSVLAIVLVGRCAHGQGADQELDVVIDRAPRQMKPEEIMARQRLRMLLSHRSNLEGWLASKYGNVDGLRDHLEARLTVRLDDLRITCHLTDLQRKKLQLAGRGDIKR